MTTKTGDGRMWRAWVERYNDPPGWRSGPKSGRTSGDARKNAPAGYTNDRETSIPGNERFMLSSDLDRAIREAMDCGNRELAIRLERERARRWQWVLRQLGQTGGQQ